MAKGGCRVSVGSAMVGGREGGGEVRYEREVAQGDE